MEVDFAFNFTEHVFFKFFLFFFVESLDFFECQFKASFVILDLTNFGDRYEFIIENILGNGDFKLKDLHTLEKYHLKDLVKFGKGPDFEIRDLL